jgi:hypothetical protein
MRAEEPIEESRCLNTRTAPPQSGTANVVHRRASRLLRRRSTATYDSIRRSTFSVIRETNSSTGNEAT